MAQKSFNAGKYDFIGKGRYLVPVLLALVVFGVIEMFAVGFNYGIDFAGGTEIQVQFQGEVTADQVRELLKEKNYAKTMVQKFGDGNEYLIRLESVTGKTEKETNEALNTMINTVTTGVKEKFQAQGASIRRVDSVGPQVGDELKKNGVLAAFYSLIIILIYIGLRFDYKYAPGAVVCLFHDVVLTLAIFSMFQLEVNVQTMAAILTLIGYSLNDTIITFDRIRENEKLYRDAPFASVVNRAINDMLARTLLTSTTTFAACAALFYFADGTIRDIAMTLGLGIVIGTISSVVIASPLVIVMDRFERHREEVRRRQQPARA